MSAHKSFMTALSLIALPLCGPATFVTAAQAEPAEAPMFEVDPFWPKPLPNHWILGMTVGVTVDSRDHVYIIHRPNVFFDERTEIGAATDPKTGECCIPAPDVMEFDPAGNLVNHWGGAGDGYTWPAMNHGITVDGDGNLWLGGNGATDSHILKFSREGRFLEQFGRPGLPADSLSHDHFAGVAEIAIDAEANEAYVADGYRNRRVAVIDADTGEMKRFWGAYGHEPEDEDLGPYDPGAPPAQQFRTPVHCVQLSNDGLVYVCDRVSNRIQVFEPDGTFVAEKRIAPASLAEGSVWDLAFSHDPEQRFVYVADGKNMKIHILDRKSLEVLTSFGDGGRYPGQFYAVHNIATDSKGNIYTTETFEGKRLQKFLYKGMAPVTTRDRGTPWPAERK